MARTRKTRNLYEQPEPDCCTCIHRKECERYDEGSYCGQWQSREPEPKGPDPNKAWEQGEDVIF